MAKEMPNLDLLPEIDLKPRVFVKKSGGSYKEVAGVQSFERSDFDSDENNVSFVLTGQQASAVKDLLATENEDLDVKMEFSLGATMVMTFTGRVENFTGDSLTFSMSTPISTEVLDDVVTLH